VHSARFDEVHALDASWVAAIASVASALVVGVAAIAALVQIRHIRNANDITTYLRLVERLDSSESRAAFAVTEGLAERLENDADLRRRLASAEPALEFDEVVALVRFLDNLTMLILVGGVSERLVLAEYADEIMRLWNSTAELIYLRRRSLGVRFGSALEHLAMRAEAFVSGGEMDRFYKRLQRDPRMADRAATEHGALTRSK
jgi:hypothetical protein